MSRWAGASGEGIQRRTGYLLVLVIVLFAILGLRLFYLQVIRTGGYLRLAADNRFLERRVPAPRGRLLDRQGRVLADNVSSCELQLRKEALNGNAPDFLALHLGREKSTLLDRLAALDENGVLVVDKDLTREEILLIEENLDRLPGVSLRNWARRRYPSGHLAAHFIGYVGQVRENELREDPEGRRPYRSGDFTGRTGLEREHESLLRGADGSELFLVNARGVLLRTVRYNKPETGLDLDLCLDIELCAALDSALTGYYAAAGVMIDARSGEVLAIASCPSFDANLLTAGIPAALWKELSEHPGKPLFDRVTRAVYAPGSTYKPLVALSALDEGMVSSGTRLTACTGGLRLGRRVFGCWSDLGHGSLDLAGSLEQSCDVYYYQIGDRLGADPLADMARRFGLGTPTGLDLSGESSGLIPDAAWYDRRFGKRGWTRGNVWNISIGQGEVLTTCLQMACVYAALAVDGRLPTPRFLRRTRNTDGEIVADLSPSPPADLGLPPEDLRAVQRGLEDVMQGRLGTARSSAIDGIRLAGKTGTVQNPHGKEHAWFCGWGPAPDAEIAMAVIVEHGEHGSDVAPVFRDLFLRYRALYPEGVDR